MSEFDAASRPSAIRPRRRRRRSTGRSRDLTPHIEFLEGRVVLSATRTWSGLGGDDLWMDAANWQGDQAPQPGDDLDFPLGAGESTDNDFPDGTEFGSITIDDGGYSFSGGAIALDGGISTTYDSGTVPFGLDVTFNASQTIAVASGTLDLSGVIDDGSPSNGYGLTKSGDGTLELDGANTYGGGTEIAAGTVDATNDSALGTGDVTIDDPASLQLDGGITLANDLTIDSTSLTALENISGTNTLNGAITLGVDSNVTIDSGTLALNGSITAGSDDLTALGSGILAVNNTIDGNGTLFIGDGVTLGGTGTTPALSAEAGSTVQPELTGTPSTLSTGAASFDSDSTLAIGIDGASEYDQLSSSGADDLGGANLSVSLDDGYIPKPGTVFTILTADGGVSGQFDDLPDGATVTAGTYPFVIHYQDDAVTLTAESRVLTWSGGAGTGNTNWSTAANWYLDTAPGEYDSLVFPGDSYPTATHNDLTPGTELTSIELDTYGLRQSGNSIVLDGGITTTYGVGTSTILFPITLGDSQTFSVHTGGTLDIKGAIDDGSPSNAYALALDGGGTLKLESADTYTGGTTVSDGTLLITDPGALGTGTVTIGGASALELALSGTTTIANALVLDSTASPSLDVESGDSTIVGTITLGAGDDGGNAFDAGIQVQSGSSLTLSNTISQYSGAGAGDAYGVVLSGGGTLTYVGSSPSTYTGTTTVSAGTLDLDDGAGGAIGGPLSIEDTGTVRDLANDQIDDQAVTLDGEQATLDLDGHDDMARGLTFTGGSVTTWFGTLALFPDGITANASPLTASISGHLDLYGTTQAIDVASGTTLDLSAAIADGAIDATGPGELDLSGFSTFRDGLTVESGASVVAEDDDSALGAGPVTVQSGGELDLDGGLTIANDLTIDGDGDGSRALDGTGPGATNTVNGTITLGGPASVGGDLISTLVLAGPIGDGSPSNGYALTINAPGTTILSAANTYGGGTTIADGLVIVVNGAALGTGAASVNGAASLRLSGGAGDLTLANDLTLDSSAALPLVNLDGTNAITGAIALGQSTTIGVSGDSRLDLDGAIGDGGQDDGLTVTGGGTLGLDGPNTYGGTTTVSAGTLEVDGSIASSFGLSLASGSTLSGNGSVPAVTAPQGSAIQPGPSTNQGDTGTLTAVDVSMASGSIFDVTLNGTMPGDDYDQLIATGTVDLNSDSGAGATLEVTLGFTPSVGDAFTLIANDGGDAVQGIFQGLPEGSMLTIDGQTFLLTYAGGIEHNEVMLIDQGTPTVNVSAEPEPSQLGQGVTFGVTVGGGGPTPTGTVTFYDGDPSNGGQPIGMAQALSDGQASISTASLSPGTHRIYAVYSGDSVYSALTASLSGGQVVEADATTTSVTADQASSVYGNQVVLTATVSQSYGGPASGTVAFYDGDPSNGGVWLGSGTLNNAGVTTFSTTTLPAGSHSIFAEYGGGPTSQSSTSPAYSEAITPAPLTITADDATKTYGHSLSFRGTEFKASGLVNGDAVTSVTLASPGADANADVSGSPYAIVASDASMADPGNYNIQYDPGALTVDPATLAVVNLTANSRPYDAGTDATLDTSGVTLSGVLGSDQVALNTSGAVGTFASKDVGTGIVVNIAGLTLNGPQASDYVLAPPSAAADITPAPLTVVGITASNRLYDGGQDAALNTTGAGLSGVLGSDQVALNASGAVGTFASKNVGTGIAVSVAGITLAGAQSGDYTLIPTALQANITPASLTITALGASKTYGQSASLASNAFVATGLLGGDSVGAVTLSSPGAGATAGVLGSPFAITPSDAVGNGLGNYAINYVAGALVVTPVPLVITAQDATRFYHDLNPTFTANYSGFVDGETPANLTSPATLSTPADAASPAGTYPIIPWGATSPNYAITYQDGTLTVVPAASAVTLAMPDPATVAGQAAFFVALVVPASVAPTGEAIFFIDGKLAGTTAVDPGTGLAVFSTTTLGVGTHVVTVVYSGDANIQGSAPATSLQVVNPAATQSSVAETFLRDRRGRIIGVGLDATVVAAAPGGGTPGGSVTYFAGRRKLETAALANGQAVLKLRPAQVPKTGMRVAYNGSSQYLASASPDPTPTEKVKAAMARPFFFRLGRGKRA